MKYMSRDEFLVGYSDMKDFEQADSFTPRIPTKYLYDDDRNGTDHIPKSIREELDLPVDLESNQINFDEVRRKDANMKRKTPQWSGQDILQATITLDQAEFVTNHFNRIRVWP